ncbi:hypothetical protein SNE40_020985 [Patella caerulea]|uniref:Phospholipid-transporting ATPase n=1 Tax=Patella caerulea TaxID=87958 RepID=A0AAN8IZU3_PATCE
MGNIIQRLRSRTKPKYRTIVPNCVVDPAIPRSHKSHPNHGYLSNKIQTTRYSVITFLPKNLFEQFHRYANLYFIFLVALNWVPEVNAFAKEITMLPVVFVLAVTAVKDAYEDFQRYRSDKKVNFQNCRKFSSREKRYVKTEWHDIHVGDFVHLSCNEIIPADILLLRSSDKEGICHIETCNIDGENNLKQRYSVKGLDTKECEFDASDFCNTIEVEQPNCAIYKFKGYIFENEENKIALNTDNLLLRGCVIRNTDFIEGICVYAGHETKALLNNRGPRYKRSKLERAINRDVVWCVVLLLFLCFFCAIGSGIWLADYNTLKENTNLVPFISFGDLDQYSPLYQGFIVFWTYVIMYQIVIPLPLYVSVELVKLGQVYFMAQDIEFYHPKSDKRLECRALNVTEDLGQIQYVFSDKTGTLTENIMEFKSCTIGGIDYPHLPGDENKSEISDLGSKVSVPSRNSSVLENLRLEPALQRELSNMCLRSLDSVELVIPRHVQRVQEFFLLMAVCNTVVVSHHPHEDNIDESGFLTDPQFVGGIASRIDQPLDKYSRLSQSSTPTSSQDQRDSLTPVPSDGSIGGSSFLSDMSSRTRYEAESPDELALVKAASTYGCRLLKRSPKTVVVWLPAEGEVELEILHILPFDSTRKRMSVILCHPLSKEITLYTKGADSAILSVLDKSFKDDDEYRLQRDQTIECLTQYAMKGLRTLCMAKRVLKADEYKSWLVNYLVASASIEEREELLFKSYCDIERDLDLLGATGIEDKLQDGVPEAIAKLGEAGIKLWVLTGDKQETAIQIAYSTKLFTKNQEVIQLNATTKEEAEALLRHHSEQISKDYKSSIKEHNTDPSTLFFREYVLVIDGTTLTFALTEELDPIFLALCQKCKAVVCCRATPIQKGNVVKLVKERLKKMTLAIGDGANDVSMIQTADIGIGISGQEGMQAVMASDFAIAQFRFLLRLLLVHGHWNYFRLSNFAAIMFYKSLITVFLLFWFQIYSGFSGSVMIDSLYLMLEHLLFVSVPPIVNGVFDKDTSAENLLNKPHLYKAGQNSKLYTKWTFGIIFLDSLYQSLVIYFITHFSYTNYSVGIWEFGTTLCVCMILIILLQIGLETNSWVWLQWLFLILSFLVFWMFAIISNAIFFTFNPPSNPYWVMENTISQAIHSCIAIIVCVLALLPRVVIKSIQFTLFPTEIDKIKQELQETMTTEEKQEVSGYDNDNVRTIQTSDNSNMNQDNASSTRYDKIRMSDHDVAACRRNTSSFLITKL